MNAEVQREFTLYPHQEIELLAHDAFDTIIHIGGKGSGKTVTLVGWMLDRSRWDTAQEHALFTYTANQREQVLQRIYPLLDEIGIGHKFNCRPPDSWIEDWKRRGIPQPPHRDRFTDAIVLETGLRIQTGTLHDRNWEQYQGPEWGSIAFEEFTTGPTQVSVERIMDRARCGLGHVPCQKHGKRDDCWCRKNHRHTKVLHGNPPDDDGHWSFDWLKKLDDNAARLSGGVKGEIPDTYPNLMRGIGSILYIQSASEENEHTGAYARNLRDRLDDETASRVLGGSMRRTRTGLAFNKYGRENIHPVKYDPSRTVWVSLDFNDRPVVAGLYHPLNPGEYPAEHQRPGITHIGKFGEIFDTKGGGLQQLCPMLLYGDAGNRGAVPRNWKGLAAHGGPVQMFGDGTGENKNASGITLWGIVDDLVGTQLRGRGIRYSRDVNRNPLVQVRVRGMNAKFCSNSGVRSFWIDQRCEMSITDYTQCVMDKTGRDLQKYGERAGGERWLRAHMADADGYLIDSLFPMGVEISSDRGIPSMPQPKFREPQM